MKDILIEFLKLYRDDNYIFYGADEDGEQYRGFYNTSKVNPKEPDLRLYRADEPRQAGREFLSLWCKIGKTGRRYLIGNKDGICYIGLINLNRFEADEPYLTICEVMKINRGDPN